jgi:26S proteasome regulatory subunit N3
MPGKTPHSNGNEPVENGIRSNQDVEMKDESLKTKGKKAAKDGDDEMTVVVPPSKTTKQLSAPPPPDGDGDVLMDASGEKLDDGAVKIDPVQQTVGGTPRPDPQTPAPDVVWRC